jgi:hypothetical protein
MNNVMTYRPTGLHDHVLVGTEAGIWGSDIIVMIYRPTGLHDHVLVGTEAGIWGSDSINL